MSSWGGHSRLSWVILAALSWPGLHAGESWAHRARLPKVRVRVLQPLPAVAGSWLSDGDATLTYRAGDPPPTEPFASPSEAEAACRAFLSAQFGPVPLDLKVASIKASASGFDRPQSPADQGHTVSFRAFWHGVELEDLFAVLYLRGRTVAMAKVNLGQPEAVAGTQTLILPRLAAIKAWRRVAETQFGMPKGLLPKVVRLVYVWSGPDNGERDEATEGTILTPQWSIQVEAGAEVLLVDATTGRVWRND